MEEENDLFSLCIKDETLKIGDSTKNSDMETKAEKDVYVKVDAFSDDRSLMTTKITEVINDNDCNVSWCLFVQEGDQIKHISSGPENPPVDQETGKLGLWWQVYITDENSVHYAFYKNGSAMKKPDEEFIFLVWIPLLRRGLDYLPIVQLQRDLLISAIGETTSVKTKIVTIEPSIGKKIWSIPREKRQEWKERALSAVHEIFLSKLKRTPEPKNRKDVISGNISTLPELPKSDILVFLSSTFLDTRSERDVYWDDVHPYLVGLSRQLGMSYCALDMRWGVKNIRSDNHGTLGLCIDNIKYCYKNSAGVNFVSILGQRRGYAPFPPVIEKDLFDALLELIKEDALTHKESEVGLKCIKEWFKMDTNFCPPKYLLQHISWKFGNYQRVPDEWWDIFESMQAAFRKASYRLSGEQMHSAYKFQIPITEAEIQEGILRDDLPVEDINKCYMFDISISEINPTDNIARAYVDMKKEGGRYILDTDAKKGMEVLKHRVEKKLPSTNYSKFTPSWSKQGITAESHSSYLKEFADNLCKFMVNSITEGAMKSEKQHGDDVYNEALQHNAVWVKNCDEFVGRASTIEVIVNMATQNPNEPIIIYGPSGSGKTFFISKSAMEIAREIKADGCVVYFLGTSPGTSSARSITQTLCLRLLALLDREAKKIELPSKFNDLVQYLHKLLQEASDAGKKLCIALDAVDQLTDEDSGRELKWLPSVLSPNILLLISTIHEDIANRRVPDVEMCYLSLLARDIPEKLFIKVPQLNANDTSSILNHWLKKDQKSLTRSQKDEILKAVKTNPSPLYMKLAYGEATKWHSYTPDSDFEIPETISDILNSLFIQLEQNHGKTMVSNSLGYITASRYGLSQNELLDILSCDEEVLKETYEYFSPPIRRLPPHCWLALRAALGPYLVERGAQGETVYAWYHRQFWEKVQERYLSGNNLSMRLNMIAAYYLCDLEQKLPYIDNVTGLQVFVSRNISSQGLVLLKGDRIHQQETVYNRRKLAELPQALLKLGDCRKDMLEALVCNTEFISAMFATGMRYELIDIMIEASKHQLAKSEMLHAFLKFVLTNADELAKYPFLAVQECSNEPDEAITHKEGGKLLEREAGGNEFARFVFTNKMKGKDPIIFSLKAMYEVNPFANIYRVCPIGRENVALAVALGVNNMYVDKGGVKIYDANNGRELTTLVQGRKIGQRSLCVSSSGKYLAYQADNTVYFENIEDLSRPKNVFKYDVENSDVEISTSEDGKFLVYHNHQNRFDLVHVERKSIETKIDILPYQGSTIVSFGYTKDGQHIVCFSVTHHEPAESQNKEEPETADSSEVKNDRIVVTLLTGYNYEEVGRIMSEKLYQNNSLESWMSMVHRPITVSNDGSLVALGFWAGTACIYNLKTGKLLAVLSRPENEPRRNIQSLAFDPMNNTLFSTYGDDIFRVWNTQAWQEEFMLTRFGNSCHVFHVSEDGNIISVIQAGNHKIQRVDLALLRTSSELNIDRPFFSNNVWQNCVAEFSPEGGLVSLNVEDENVIISSSDGKKLAANKLEPEMCKVKVGLEDVSLVPTEKELTVKRVSMDDCQEELFRINAKAKICSVLPSSGNVVLILDTNNVAVYRKDNGDEVQKSGQRFNNLLDVKCTYSDTAGERIALIFEDQSIALLDSESLQIITYIQGVISNAYGRTNCFYVSPCGLALATRSDMQNATASFFTPEGLQTMSIEGATTSDYLACVAVYPKRQLFSAGGWKGDLTLYDLKEGVLLNRLDRSKTDVHSVKVLSFSPCGRYLISFGSDGDTLSDGGNVRLWNARNLQLLGLFNSKSGTNITCGDIFWLTKEQPKEDEKDASIIAKVACLDWNGNIYLLHVHDRLQNRMDTLN